MSFFTLLRRYKRLTQSVSLLLAAAVLFSSCSSQFATVTIKTDPPVKGRVTATVSGAKSTDVYTVKSFPWNVSIDYDNMPAYVSFSAEKDILKPITINKIYLGSRAHKGWNVAGGWFTALGAISMIVGGFGFIKKGDLKQSYEAPADDDDEHLIPVNVNQAMLLYGGIGMAAGITFLSIGGARAAAKVYAPEQKVYTVRTEANLDRYDVYARQYVEPRLADWQKKGEFETMQEYNYRVTPTTTQAKLDELTQEAAENFIERSGASSKIRYTLGTYDSENQTFMVTSNYGNVVVSVPRSEAESFKRLWNSIRKTPQFGINGVEIALTECKFTDYPKTYIGKADGAAAYAPVDISGSLANLDKVKFTGSDSKLASAGSSTTVTLSRDKIDTNIPRGKENKNTYVVIIGNENYKNADNVPFALNDADIFSQYCNKTLGIPESNIKIYKDATRNDMIMSVEWLKKMADSFGRDKNVIFYYAGHGVPDPGTLKGLLLPTDAYPESVATAYKLDDLYSALNELGVDNVTVLLDACFSGAKRNGGLLASDGQRGVAIKSKESKPEGNMIVLSAASGEQSANPYDDKSHGMFTYYLLEELNKTKGNVTLGDLFNYIQTNVKQQATLKGKDQTPTATSSDKASDWRSRSLAK